jgi:ABC-type enterochelin transport system ATPase subunit
MRSHASAMAVHGFNISMHRDVAFVSTGRIICRGQRLDALERLAFAVRDRIEHLHNNIIVELKLVWSIVMLLRVPMSQGRPATSDIASVNLRYSTKDQPALWKDTILFEADGALGLELAVVRNHPAAH